MAKVYSAPIPAPKYDYKASNEVNDAAEDAYVARLAELAKKKNSTSDLIGKTIQFQVADGYARYMVWTVKPLALVHLELGDAWQIPAAHSRGLRLSDVKAQVEYDTRLQKLFTKDKEIK